MKIGFIGTGNVGGTLALALGKKGHSVYLGSRNPKAADIVSLLSRIGGNASGHSLSEAIGKSEVIVLALPWKITEEVVKSFSKELSGKILIDCTNPLKEDLSGLVVGHSTSGGEIVQAAAPLARVFKAFNTTGFNIMENPVLESRKSAMYFCGDDQGSRDIVRNIVADVGFEPVDGGPLSTARLLEPFALLWIASAYKFGQGREFSFNIIRKGKV